MYKFTFNVLIIMIIYTYNIAPYFTFSFMLINKFLCYFTLFHTLNTTNPPSPQTSLLIPPPCLCTVSSSPLVTLSCSLVSFSSVSSFSSCLSISLGSAPDLSVTSSLSFTSLSSWDFTSSFSCVVCKLPWISLKALSLSYNRFIYDTT